MEKTLSYLRRICAQREYCRKDIYEKALKRLEKAGEEAAENGKTGFGEAAENGKTATPSALAWKAVDTLESEGFICEARYALAYARDKSSIKGWGSVKIAYMLRGKGIGKEDIETALAEIDSTRSDKKLLSALQKKAIQLKNDPQLKIKLLKFAASRGYAYDQAQALVTQALAKSNEYED